jgi:hypothetical protein
VVLLMQLATELAALEKSAKARGRFAKFEAEFKDLGTRLQRIDPKSPDAMSEIRDLYFTGLMKLKAGLEKAEEDGKLSRKPLPQK